MACCILDASYEITLAAAAILSRKRNERISVFLTKLGGGAFGNSELWILYAI
jgi:hypothetical protein